MNVRFLIDRILELRTSRSLTSAKIIILIIFCVTLSLLFISDLILKSSPPELPQYLDHKFDNSPSENELLGTLSWHLKNNLGSLLAEEDTCSLWIEVENTKKPNFQLNCPAFNFHMKELIDSSKLNSLRSSFSNNTNYWRNLYEKTNNNLVSFSPFSLKISGVSIDKISPGILGKEIAVKIEFEVIGFSDAYKNIAHYLQDNKTPFDLDGSSHAGRKLANTVIFRSNKYGYYLPVMGLL